MFREEQYLKVKTVNGSPSVMPVAQIIFPNSSVTDNGDGSVTVTFPLSVSSGDYLYFGDSGTDGSWRIYVSGANLIIEKRESGSWVEKGAYLP